MQLTINDKDYTFKFGLRFVRELDKQITTNENGIEFGVGTAVKLAQIVNAKDLAALTESHKRAKEHSRLLTMVLVTSSVICQ